MTELDIRSRSAELTALTVRHTPDSGGTDCHTVSVTQGATSGRGAALHVTADNTASTAVIVRGGGALLRLYNAAGTQRLSVAADGTVTVTGSLTVSGALTAASQSVSGNLTVTGTLGVSGAATLSSTLGVTGAATLNGALTVAGTATLNGAVTVAGYTTLAGAQANSDFVVFGSLSALGPVATLGAKNGLTGVKLCGQKETAGAPTTGTWDTGDVVLDSAGVWHRCLTGGTPGTWS
ncbi:hypothetical protein [Streptomyces syringium]|uniref:hypothetical protein n=1 Tax=Streptomyces syringium TaxID=76729 RepID=UPI0033D5146C